MADIIDGRAVSQRLRAAIAADVARLDEAPGLATILVGDDPASAVYVASKRKACAEAGITSVHHPLPAATQLPELLGLIDELNADPCVSGILCQLPLPAHLDAAVVIERIDPDKDVDGLTVANAGRLALGQPGLRPCTPAGVMDLLAEAGAELRGGEAVVIGRSNLFGKPMAQMLLAADATVTCCHRYTRALNEQCARADVLIAAVGQPGLVRGTWIKPGATVIDVGINRTDDGLVGDVEFEAAAEIAGAITPVPGGVGPMTIACLLRNTLISASRTQRAREAA
ncbi:MAG TPA: bifunctional methylenetetrahydrofolate dehydrogenase/methenyltetrahydrofolate cyclohydrolase FolD [Baekduia sp.]|nr:bifunctional methylenetetrahydrofolate dehydrogenase/methenyltetrahydrofolate cyclohydrolase FolD [Baekduia sp.]HET6508996.1 bifunctional methylenetetrahydrofolate dehydrogenase/methenyltetrahydrofolate cyclohydrolase FolD [Baekduia sp.]